MPIIFPEIEYYSIEDNFNLLYLKTEIDIFTCDIIYNVGSSIESKDEYGLAHFLEHMIFKGKINGKSIGNSIDYVGATSNASTSSEITRYYINGLNDHYEFIINTILQMLFEPQFPEEDIKNEIGVVMEEYHNSTSNVTSQLYRLINRALFKDIDDGLTRPILGTERHIRSFTREKLLDFYNKRYIPCKKTMVVLGNVSIENILKVVKTRFKTIKSWIPEFQTLDKELIVPHHKVFPSPLLYINFNFRQPATRIFFRSISVHSSWSHIQSTIDHILYTRLFNLLRNELGVTYSQSVYSLKYNTHGIYTVSFNVNTDVLQNTLTHVINMLLNFDITDDELYQAKNSIKTTLVTNSCSIVDAAGYIMNYICIDNTDPINYINYIKKVDQMTKLHICNFANKIFKRENMCVVIGGNEDELRSMHLTL
jgi:predicted Zn-dependent peptidase